MPLGQGQIPKLESGEKPLSALQFWRARMHYISGKTFIFNFVLNTQWWDWQIFQRKWFFMSEQYVLGSSLRDQ